MVRIAVGTMQVTAGEADEYRRSAGIIPFSLEGVEYFVDFIGFHSAASSKPSFTYTAMFPSDSWNITL